MVLLNQGNVIFVTTFAEGHATYMRMKRSKHISRQYASYYLILTSKMSW